VVVESTSEAELALLAQDIVDAFKAPFVLGKATVYFNVSIGLVLCDASYLTVPNVLRDADIAMYRAKAGGKSTYQIFDSDIQKATLELAELESALYSAVENNDFKLAYQPIIDLETGLLSGFEALVRWEHPEKGIISPYTFIPIAEETGLIWHIGQWVLLEACRQTKLWHDMGLAEPPTISVNISSNQLKNNTFLNVLDKIIEQTGLDSKYLKLELTESVLIENNHALSELFSALQAREIDLAIDDFGTGYSSLAYLNEMPAQFLKIDRCFVSAIDHNSDSTINKNALEIVKATISLGKSLSKKVTAEGIETNTQLISLIRHGCDFIQGYFLSKPLSDKDATELLESPRDVANGGVNISKETYAQAYAARVKLSQQND
jgi:EAL domain-containing protein (putative c-di-GMP-specific phosphodiesterase class I)